MESRYSRQIIFEQIGEDGQKKLLNSTIAIIGLGALGTVSANNLTRAGIGHIKLIDRDYVELSNLQRQLLYTEEDVVNEKPKAIAAFDHLTKINSSIKLEPIIADVNSVNIEQMLSGCDLILDCTDNFETRFLINEVCDKQRIPWIYCGAIGSSCMTMNIIPGETPCFHCLSGNTDTFGPAQTCSTVGVLNMATSIAASIQSSEAIKILLGSEDIRKSLFFIDIWNNSAEYLGVLINPSCPVCGEHIYAQLGKSPISYATSLCGRNEIQVVPGKAIHINFEELADTLTRLGDVTYNNFMLKFHDEKISIKLFNDGRAIIENAKDLNHAKAVYTAYLGY